MITIEKISKEFDTVRALDEVSFTARPGQQTMIMGPSGSGKSTLIHLIAGLEEPTSGSIEVGGRDITQLNEVQLREYRRDEVGIVFQKYHLIDYLTALENVMLSQYFHSMPEEEDAMQSLRMVGLEDRASHLPSKLSGGEQQRVAIARAITNDPQIILADEPTGNLDVENERIVMDIFDALKAAGKTIVIVTHNLALTDHSDQIISLKHGKVVNQPQPPQSQTDDVPLKVLL